MRVVQAVVADVLIDVIGHQQHVRRIQQHIGQRPQLGGAVAGAGRVAWRVEQQPAGTRGNSVTQLCGGQLEGVLLGAGQGHGFAFAGQHHVRVRHPVGRRDQHLVTRAKGGGKGIENRAFRTAGDQHLAGCVAQAVFPLQLVDNGLAQLRGAGVRCVAGFAALYGSAGRCANVRRCVEVRFADHQVDDRFALPAQLIGAIGRSTAG